MALGRMRKAGKLGLQASTAIGALMLSAGLAAADFPGDRWSVTYVQVEGDPATANAVNLGLTQANETYFYGDRPTRMDARVRGNLLDVRIVDSATGQVIAKETGLPIDTSGDVAGSVATVALGWMDGLACDDGCALAYSGAAPSAQVQVAAAPAPAEPVLVEPLAAEQPAETEQPAIADAGAETGTSETELAAAAQPDLTEPSTNAPSSAEIAAIVQAPSAAASDPEQGVENPAAPTALADATRSDAASLAQPALGAAAPAAASSDPGSAVTGLDADQVLAEAAKTEAARLAQPSLAAGAAPATGGSESAVQVAAPSTPSQPTVEAPALAAAPAATQEAPSASGTSEAPSVSAPTGLAAATPELAAPAAPSGQADSDTTQVAATPEQSLQEVAPGVSLPQPGAGSAPSPLGQVAGAAPSAQTGSDTAPSAVAAVAPAEAEAGTEVGTLQPSTASAGASPSADTASSAVAAVAQPAAGAEEPATSGVAALAQAAASAAAPSAAVSSVAPAAETEAPSPEPATPSASTNDLDGEVLALANPASPSVPEPTAGQSAVSTPQAPAVQPQVVQPRTQTEAPAGTETDSGTTVETRIASVDPDAAGPTLANARWVGFTPAVFTGADNRGGIWISGPFDRKERTGWITDTATGATTRVTFVWREGGRGGRTAILSREAARALGLGQGDVANVAVYLPR